MSHQAVKGVAVSGHRVSGLMTSLQWRHIDARTLTTSTVRREEERHCPVLTLENMNPNVKIMEYAVRGPLVIRASQIEKELKEGKKKPFDEVIKANIGDCQAMGQIPVTFIRQVIALVSYPPLLNDPNFADDAKAKAKLLLEHCPGGSSGSYTDSAGIEIVRRHAAEYIEKRDAGIKSDFNNIYLTTGATAGIRSILNILRGQVCGKNTAVMVPVPQYPLYSATLAEFGMDLVGYYLDEGNNWALHMTEMQKAYDEALKHCYPRALVVINPGNPTGQVLTQENIKELIKFARCNRLFLLADEVYQDNVYATGCKFHSVKKVMTEMGPPYCEMELVSFMSCSKGFMGECGIRGGYMELFNMVPEVQAMLLKSLSAKLCSPVTGQVAMDCVVNPPKPGDVSCYQFHAEKEKVLKSLAERAIMASEAFNSTAGMSCNTVQGAMYAFPKLNLPEKAVAKAKERGMAADVMYAFELLENMGICVVPGTGFGQKEGTYHFRTTILPQPKKLKPMLEKIVQFHKKFLAEYK